MLVSRAQLSAVERERDEWRKRAETRTRVRTRTEVVFMRTPLWVRSVVAVWLVLLGLLVGGAAMPRADESPTVREDYSACISEARQTYPLATSQYRELMNALYACGIYERQ